MKIQLTLTDGCNSPNCFADHNNGVLTFGNGEFDPKTKTWEHRCALCCDAWSSLKKGYLFDLCVMDQAYQIYETYGISNVNFSKNELEKLEAATSKVILILKPFEPWIKRCVTFIFLVDNMFSKLDDLSREHAHRLRDLRSK